MTGKLGYPFAHDDEDPFYLVALGNGEYVRVVLAGFYLETWASMAKYQQIAVELYAQLRPLTPIGQCEREVIAWHDDLRSCD